MQDKCSTFYKFYILCLLGTTPQKKKYYYYYYNKKHFKPKKEI